MPALVEIGAAVGGLISGVGGAVGAGLDAAATGVGTLASGVGSALGVGGAAAAGDVAATDAAVAGGTALAGDAAAGTGALALADTAAPLATDAFAGAGAGVPFADLSAPLTDTGILGTGADVGSTISPSITGTAMDSAITGAASGGPSITGLASYAPTQAAEAAATLPAAAGAAGAGAESVSPLGSLATLAGDATVPGVQGAVGLTGAPAAAAGGGGLAGLLAPLGITPAQGLGVAAAGGGLLYNLLKPNQYPETGVLQGEAGQINKMLTDFQNGKLPPGYTNAIKSATQAANAATISSYASRGQPTDPTKNTQLARDLAANQNNAIILSAKIGEQLLQGGLHAVGLESQIYQMLLTMDQQQTAATGQAIGNFAAALAGGKGTSAGLTPGTTLTVS